MTDLHVIPVNDLVGHESSDDCACGPRFESVPRDDGSIGWIAVHPRLDARERSEQ